MTVPLLEQLRVQLESDEITEVIETADELRSTFAADRTRTEQVDTLATAVRYRSASGSPPAVAANDHLEAATALEQQRVALLEPLLNYTTGEGSADAVLDQIDPTIEAYRELENARESVQDHAESVTLGSILALGPLDDYRIPKGKTQRRTTTLSNVGDEDADSLSLTVSETKLVSAEIDPESIATLGGNSERSVSLLLTGERVGTGRGRFAVEGERRESVEFRVEVLDKEGFLSEALTLTERLSNELETRELQGPLKGVQKRVDKIETQLSKLVKTVDQKTGTGKNTRRGVNNRIGAVGERFEALLGTLTDNPNIDLTRRTRAEYVRLCEDAIAVIDLAIQAEI